MLPFSLKVVWFALSLSGLICCWPVLLSFSRIIGTTWGPLLYLIGCTILQGTFCLGMIYRMNPYFMPRAFCIAQTILIGYATFLMAGVAGAFSVATALAVQKPKSWGDTNSIALKWRRIYYLPVLVFPIVASAAHIAVVLALDSSKPSDDLHCDSSDPIWVRFLGYAGIPCLVSIPCLCLSSISIYRISQTHKHIARARHDDDDADNFTSLPYSRAKEFQLTGRAISSPSPSAKVFSASRREPISPSISSPVLSAQGFHLPFTRHSQKQEKRSSSVESSARETDGDSIASSSFPTFVNPAVAISPPDNGERSGSSIEFSTDQKKENWREILGSVPLESTTTGTVTWEEPADGKTKSEYDFGIDEEEQPNDDAKSWTRAGRTLGFPFKRRSKPQRLPPVIHQIIQFQIAFSIVQGLMCLSTIIDVARHRPQPTPFGTQHVALLLSVWGPVLLFGHSPLVRQNLFFRRPAS